MEKKEKTPDLLSKEEIKGRRDNLRSPQKAAGEQYHKYYVEDQGVIFPKEDCDFDDFDYGYSYD